MKKEKLEKRLNDLDAIKKEWNKKYDDMLDVVKGYEPTTDQAELDKFQEKLDSCQKDVIDTGQKYKDELKSVVKEMEEDANNPIVSQLCKPVFDDIDDDYAKYKGNRENRLRDINEIIEMYLAANRH